MCPICLQVPHEPAEAPWPENNENWSEETPAIAAPAAASVVAPLPDNADWAAHVEECNAVPAPPATETNWGANTGAW